MSTDKIYSFFQPSIADCTGEVIRDIPPNGWDIFYLKLAQTVSTKSKDPSTKVGAVIVRPDMTVAGLGFNGFPRFMPDNPEWLNNREEKYSRVIHAEMNALLHTKEMVRGYTMYCTLLPCDRCIVHVIQAGIDTIVVPEPPEDLKIRWADAFNRSKQYAQECDVLIYEVPQSLLAK